MEPIPELRDGPPGWRTPAARASKSGIEFKCVKNVFYSSIVRELDRFQHTRKSKVRRWKNDLTSGGGGSGGYILLGISVT